MSLLDRILNRPRIDSGYSRAAGRSQSPSDLPIDHRLPLQQGVDEWRYDADTDTILLNGDDVEEKLDFERRAVREWGAISAGLADYKEFVRVKGSFRFGEFAHRVDRIQDRILGMMQRVYEEKVNGFYLKWIDGVPFFNTVNVKALIVLFQFNPTAKARLFLEGVRARLRAFLNARASMPLDRVGQVVSSMIGDVDRLLDCTPTHYPRLAAGDSPARRERS